MTPTRIIFLVNGQRPSEFLRPKRAVKRATRNMSRVSHHFCLCLTFLKKLSANDISKDDNLDELDGKKEAQKKKKVTVEQKDKEPPRKIRLKQDWCWLGPFEEPKVKRRIVKIKVPEGWQRSQRARSAKSELEGRQLKMIKRS